MPGNTAWRKHSFRICSQPAVVTPNIGGHISTSQEFTYRCCLALKVMEAGFFAFWAVGSLPARC